MRRRARPGADSPPPQPVRSYSPRVTHEKDSRLEALAASRWRIAMLLTVAMMAIYFGFILLVAFNKPLLGTQVADGLSLGILLGVLVSVAAWALTWVYVRWANTHYDAAIESMRR